MIIHTAAEDPTTKANAFRVPPYNYLNWQKMRGLGVFTIEDMIKEWRYYLIFLKNKGIKNTTLAQVVRKLVMELELKITEVELIRDCEKKLLESQVLKACNLYLKHIKMDRYRIKYLVDCFLSTTAKKQREKSTSSDSETDTKHQKQRASRISSREKEVKMDRVIELKNGSHL